MLGLVVINFKFVNCQKGKNSLQKQSLIIFPKNGNLFKYGSTAVTRRQKHAASFEYLPNYFKD